MEKNDSAEKNPSSSPSSPAAAAAAAAAATAEPPKEGESWIDLMDEGENEYNKCPPPDSYASAVKREKFSIYINGVEMNENFQLGGKDEYLILEVKFQKIKLSDNKEEAMKTNPNKQINLFYQNGLRMTGHGINNKDWIDDNNKNNIANFSWVFKSDEIKITTHKPPPPPPPPPVTTILPPPPPYIQQQHHHHRLLLPPPQWQYQSNYYHHNYPLPPPPPPPPIIKYTFGKKQLFGFIVGKGRKLVSGLENLYNVKIQVPGVKDPSNTITVMGYDLVNVNNAISEINEKLEYFENRYQQYKNEY